MDTQEQPDTGSSNHDASQHDYAEVSNSLQHESDAQRHVDDQFQTSSQPQPDNEPADGSNELPDNDDPSKKRLTNAEKRRLAFEAREEKRKMKAVALQSGDVADPPTPSNERRVKELGGKKGKAKNVAEPKIISTKRHTQSQPHIASQDTREPIVELVPRKTISTSVFKDDAALAAEQLQQEKAKKVRNVLSNFRHTHTKPHLLWSTAADFQLDKDDSSLVTYFDKFTQYPPPQTSAPTTTNISTSTTTTTTDPSHAGYYDQGPYHSDNYYDYDNKYPYDQGYPKGYPKGAKKGRGGFDKDNKPFSNGRKFDKRDKHVQYDEYYDNQSPQHQDSYSSPSYYDKQAKYDGSNQKGPRGKNGTKSNRAPYDDHRDYESRPHHDVDQDHHADPQTQTTAQLQYQQQLQQRALQQHQLAYGHLYAGRQYADPYWAAYYQQAAYYNQYRQPQAYGLPQQHHHHHPQHPTPTSLPPQTHHAHTRTQQPHAHAAAAAAATTEVDDRNFQGLRPYNQSQSGNHHSGRGRRGNYSSHHSHDARNRDRDYGQQ